MSKRKRKSQQPVKRRNNAKLLGLLGLLGIILVGGFIFLNMVGPDTAANQTVGATFPLGPPTTCQSLPKFVEAKGLDRRVLIDTSQRRHIGVALQAPNGESYQHPTWDDAGNIGPFALDKLGTIYLAPVPQVSLYNNPPAEQNKIYRIDTVGGEMHEYVNLPWAAPPSASNPFGVVGLAYDCDTHSLYAASLAGSSQNAEVGRLYQLDLESGDVAAQFDDVDALGIGIFNSASGKRLYYGSARTSDLYSISLNSRGNFNGDPHRELSLAALPGGAYDNPHRIRFNYEQQMEVKGIEFGFRLSAASDPLRNIYTFTYNPTTNAWDFEHAELQ